MVDFYDQATQAGESAIEHLIKRRTQEGLQLDFKQKEDPSVGAYSDGDKKVLAKALSAFSNSAGGLIIWGVEAKKGADGVDCAHAPKPISNIELFLSQTSTLVAQLIQPKHDGIEVQAVRSRKIEGSGYLLLRVARSERRPHRSEAKDQKNYYKRMADNSIMMEHYDIEDAFRRFSNPKLCLTWSISTVLIYGDGRKEVQIAMQIQNNSRITAKYPYLQVRDVTMPAGSCPAPGYSVQGENGWLVYSTGSDKVINPGTSSTVFQLGGLIEEASGFYSSGGGLLRGNVAHFFYRLGCENSEMSESFFIISDRDLQDWRPT